MLPIYFKLPFVVLEYFAIKIDFFISSFKALFVDCSTSVFAAKQKVKPKLPGVLVKVTTELPCANEAEHSRRCLTS